jgi:hypothetical protein
MHDYHYQHFLNLQIPEEVILVLLADFGKEMTELVVEKILGRLLQLKGKPILLRKYLRQMVILARLRTNLSETLQKQLEAMAITYNIEKDTLYQKGMEKGKYLKAVKFAEKCLQEGLGIPMTVKLTELTIEEVMQIAWRLGIGE